MINGYRRVRPDYSEFAADLNKMDEGLPEREEYLKTIKSFFTLKQIDADWDAVQEASDESLVTSLAMVCPFAPSEKQALLECSDLKERGALLMSLMKMAVHGEQQNSAPHTH